MGGDGRQKVTRPEPKPTEIEADQAHQVAISGRNEVRESEPPDMGAMEAAMKGNCSALATVPLSVNTANQWTCNIHAWHSARQLRFHRRPCGQPRIGDRPQKHVITEWPFVPCQLSVSWSGQHVTPWVFFRSVFAVRHQTFDGRPTRPRRPTLHRSAATG